MRTTRRMLRGAASALALGALLIGAAACTGDKAQDPSETGTAPGDSASGSTEPDETQDASDGASDGGGESPFSDAELAAASERFVEFLHVLDDRDWEAACDTVLDPTTGRAPEGERLEDCVDGVEPTFAEQPEMLRPGAFDAVDASMVGAADSGDGTVALSVLGDELEIPMAPGEDGRWYLVIPF